MSDSVVEKFSNAEVISSKKEVSIVSATQEVHQALMDDPLGPQINDLCLWKDPVRSGLVFGFLNVCFYCLTFGEYSVLTLSAYIVMFLVLGSLGATVVTMVRSRVAGAPVENPLASRLAALPPSVSEDCIAGHVATVTRIVNVKLTVVRSALMCDDLLFTFKFLATCYLVSVVGNWFSALCLMWLSTLIHFVWPRLYQEKQKEIDEVYGTVSKQVMTKYNEVYAQVEAKLPPRIAAMLNPKKQD